jgi:hypothetical protein
MRSLLIPLGFLASQAMVFYGGFLVGWTMRGRAEG